MYNKYKKQKLSFLENISSKNLLYVKGIYYICTTKTHQNYMKQSFLYTLVLICSIYIPVTVRATVRDVLKELDKTILQKSIIKEKKLSYIDSLQKASTHSKGKELTHIYYELCNAYSNFQSDSCLHYSHLLYRQAQASDDQRMKEYALLKQAYALSLIGMYSHANQLLDSIRGHIVSSDGLLHYMHTRRAIYGWLADYAKPLPPINVEYDKQTEIYRDSILMLETDPIRRAVCQADSYISQWKLHEADSLLHSIADKAGDKQKAYLLYSLSSVKRGLMQNDSVIYYLAETALYDLQRGVTEYAALQELAVEMKQLGNIERAYNYLVCAMEDASYCNATLRSVATSQIYPIINHAHQAVESSRQMSRNLAILAFFLLALVSIGTAVYYYFESKRLNTARAQLAQTNQQLAQTNLLLEDHNHNLREMDDIKEKYLTYYLSRCHTYIESMERLRRMLTRLVKTGQLNEIGKMLKSGGYFEDEKLRFQADFDNVFLKTHPNFVEKFNTMLRPEHRIVPPIEGRLTPELRIFALMRLGIKEVSEIAQLLDYSNPTIYNYRSRTFAASDLDKKEFERRLMEI